MTSALVATGVGFVFLVTVFLVVITIAEVVNKTTYEQRTWIGITTATLVISYVSGKVILVVLRTEGIL